MFAKIQNSTVIIYPYSWVDFVADNNNTNYPPETDMLALFPQTDAAKDGFDLVEVTTTPQPAYSSDTQRIAEANPTLVGDAWKQTWFVADLPLDQAQAGRIATLTAAYRSAIQAPVTFSSACGVTKTYQADAAAVSNLTKMLLAFAKSAAVPTGFFWASEDNTRVPFTYADMEGLAELMGAQGGAAFAHLQEKKSAVRAAKTAADVRAISW